MVLLGDDQDGELHERDLVRLLAGSSRRQSRAQWVRIDYGCPVKETSLPSAASVTENTPRDSCVARSRRRRRRGRARLSASRRFPPRNSLFERNLGVDLHVGMRGSREVTPASSSIGGRGRRSRAAREPRHDDDDPDDDAEDAPPLGTHFSAQPFRPVTLRVRLKRTFYGGRPHGPRSCV